MLDDIPRKVMWKGMPVEDLLRDELLEVVMHFARENEELEKQRRKLCAAVDWRKYFEVRP